MVVEEYIIVDFEVSQVGWCDGVVAWVLKGIQYFSKFGVILKVLADLCLYFLLDSNSTNRIGLEIWAPGKSISGYVGFPSNIFDLKIVFLEDFKPPSLSS